ncbi:hypothetical protein U1Q18_039090 [Sarracenia purpurea var. burkii]
MESHIYSSLSSTKKLKKSRTFPPPPPPPPAFRSALHSVRKPPAKPWKFPIAPLPPTLPKIYKVDSVDFKQVVQKLTAEPEFQSRRLQRIVPPPLSLSTTAAITGGNTNTTTTTTTTTTTKSATIELLSWSPDAGSTTPPLSPTYRELMSETLNVQSRKQLSESCLGASSPSGFSLSPSSNAWWCSFPLLSPGTLACLE